MAEAAVEFVDLPFEAAEQHLELKRAVKEPPVPDPVPDDGGDILVKKGLLPAPTPAAPVAARLAARHWAGRGRWPPAPAALVRAASLRQPWGARGRPVLLAFS